MKSGEAFTHNADSSL